jgi:phosphopantothenoylcysteine decarboxylase/phosphopantothenate--cysteine ligase
VGIEGTKIMTIALLEDKRILLGVTGSIACYKTVDLASKLTQAGALVDVIMTESSLRFVSALSFRSVTGRAVYTDMWDQQDHVGHVRLGESADLFIIAPATAHTIAKLAHGMADNLLTVAALAARCPQLVAPAMDGGMFEHPATQANLNILRQREVIVAGPGEGRMASGLHGKGRMLEPMELLGHVRLVLGRDGSLHERRVVVTAGPTQEPLDPVRFLSNRSSGKQGLALAQAALDAGAHVTLVAGPVHEPIPIGAKYVPVRTAAEMFEAVLAHVEDADVLIMAAAVSDFRPQSINDQKMKKSQVSAENMAIPLARNPDILAELGVMKQQGTGATAHLKLTVGFAAETHDVIRHGREKLQRKGLDWIAINDVSVSEAGFAVDTNRILLLSAEGEQIELPLQSKGAISESIIATVARDLARHDN